MTTEPAARRIPAKLRAMAGTSPSEGENVYSLLRVAADRIERLEWVISSTKNFHDNGCLCREDYEKMQYVLGEDP